MTAAPAVVGPEAEIERLLRAGARRTDLIRVGIYRRSWLPADVDRVIRRLREREGHRPDAPRALRRQPQPRQVRHVWTPPRHDGQPRTVVLTARLGQVLTELCTGASNAAIAGRLHVTEDTVKSHVQALLRLLGATSRGHAIVLALTGAVTVHVTD